jgi:hypothetical protein
MIFDGKTNDNGPDIEQKIALDTEENNTQKSLIELQKKVVGTSVIRDEEKVIKVQSN